MGLFDRFRKKKKPTVAAPEVEMTRHCFVLSGSDHPEDLSRASEVVSRVFGAGYTAEVDEKNIVTISCGEEAVGFLAHMPAPIPDGEAETNADGNFLWPHGKEEAAQHRSHVIVTNIGGDDLSPVASAIEVSRLALVALQLFDGIGVYWGNACVCYPRGLFEEFCDQISEDQLPVPMWLRFQLLRVTDDELGIYTLGMSQFGLMDIEIDRCQLDLEELFEFVSNLAHYLIQSGPVIADGNTVGGSEDERIVVRHAPSMIESERQVYKLIFE